MFKTMSSDDWSDAENDATVASYFTMLGDELAGRPYVKAEQNRLLQEQIGRSRGAIEFKYCNVSAAAMGLGLPIIRGYQPRFNFQMSLAEAISRWLAQHPNWDLLRKDVEVAEAPSLFVGVAPTLRNAPPPKETEMLQAIARRFDVAGRDERNRALGKAGEELVFQREQALLRRQGKEDLAKRVRWISHEDGDGAGYDILSFMPDGRDRLIEVKTTNGWDRTPFYLSRNELTVADAHRENWFLFRLYDFARTPRAFELRPPLEAHVELTAMSFQASF
ncbi:MAG: DUF3883 domain-containing protein [Roseibium sp.]|uniref:DUF3883 domain-containing protein n=1 Tax=Roseibium sp. TaxID=1936156 RepID=UPI003D9C5309